MKKLTVFIFSVMLAGCSLLPTKRNFPDAPEELKTPCPELHKVVDGAKLSDVLQTVTENYGQYHECRVKNDAWNEWYKKQKEIFESVK